MVERSGRHARLTTGASKRHTHRCLNNRCVRRIAARFRTAGLRAACLGTFFFGLLARARFVVLDCAFGRCHGFTTAVLGPRSACPQPWGLTLLCVSGIPLAGRGASSGGRHPPFFRGVPRSLGDGPERRKRQGAFSLLSLRKRPLSPQVPKNSLVFSWELKGKPQGVTRRW